MRNARNTATATRPSPMRSRWRCSSRGSPRGGQRTDDRRARAGRRRAVVWRAGIRRASLRRPRGASCRRPSTAGSSTAKALRKCRAESPAPAYHPCHGGFHPPGPRPRRRGRPGHRPGPAALAAARGLRRQDRLRRRGRARRVPRLPARPHHPRPRAPSARRDRRGQAPARGRGRHADPDPDRPRCARGPRGGARRRGRRLPGEAVRAPGAAGAHARAPAAPAAPRDGAAAGRRPDAQPRHARGHARHARDRADAARVRAARVHDAQRAAGHLAPEAARRGLGLRPVLDHEHDRGVRVQPEEEGRSRWRAWAPTRSTPRTRSRCPAPTGGGRSKPVASLGSYTRSAARATSSAHRRIPIRWRLAGGSAALPLVIPCGFATIVGVLPTKRIQSDFNRQVAGAAGDLAGTIQFQPYQTEFGGLRARWKRTNPDLDTYAAPQNAAIRVVYLNGDPIKASTNAPDFGPPQPRPIEDYGWRVESRPTTITLSDTVYVQYARRISDVRATSNLVKLFLAFGVLGGAALALLAGLATSRRAMAPIAELTAAARRIARTRDASTELPHPEAEDEVAELARTLESMLASLGQAGGAPAAAPQRHGGV